MRALRRNTFSLLLVALAATAVFVDLQAPAGANHQPADKIAVAGSGLQVMSASIVTGTRSEPVSLLKARIKTSSPTDLLFEVTAECALWTNIKTVGNDDSEAMASVKVWVELDGKPVPVSSDDTTEPGKVVFCNRAFRSRVTNLNDEDKDATFEHFMRTRSANAFNWMRLNVGSAIHSVEVMAQLELAVVGTGEARAAVGKRTLFVLPGKLANNAVI